ncbi:MAG: hypothetical protein JW834_02190 [Candidatus Diapherotrites archaeon]|nr:hypothetical protein [Candidatus Diapherotrites archaeon]
MDIEAKLEEIRKSVGRGDHLNALFIIEQISKHLKKLGQKNEDLESLRKYAYQVGILNKMKEAGEALERGAHIKADTQLVIASEYSRKGGVELPAEYETLRTKTSRMGMDKELEKAWNASQKGNHPATLQSLTLAEKYAERGNLEIPERFKTLGESCRAKVRKKRLVL